MTCMRARTSSNFGQIRLRAAELWPFKDVRNWFLLNILRMDGQNLSKFCIHIIIDKIYIAIVKRHFSQICNRVTALDRCQKSVFAKYLENGWTEFEQILYTLYHWQDLCLCCKGLFFYKFATELLPLIYIKNCFCSIPSEWIDRIQPTLLYTHHHGQGLGCSCKL